ncbi:SDR family NAD(P)-dependent oxidoreductase [Candidatus Bathyarchaeota archaeon]|nr:SDR family NAD(P)-dependent oxidoreductase [Candidatus Bathyarchaeota archaeon]
MLKGKKAIITGAGGGIGSAIAYGFAEFGVDVALLDLKVEEIEGLKNF